MLLADIKPGFVEIGFAALPFLALAAVGFVVAAIVLRRPKPPPGE